MKPSPTNLHPSRFGIRTAERARAAIILLVLAVFLLGLGGGAYWYRQAAKPGAAADASPSLVEFSAALKGDLQRISSPVEIRLYAPASQAGLPESVQAFASRVDQLVAWYEQEAGGKIHLTRLDPQATPEATAAAKADGIKPSPLANGEVYYLGLALVYQGQKETLAPLVPEWEMALPSDLSRAILRLTASKAAARSAANASAADPATTKLALQDIARTLPNLDAVNAAEGSQKLRESALEQFKAAVSEMQTRVDAAQQKLAEAQRGKSTAEQQAALKQLQQVQAEQTEKLKQITQRLQDQIATFEQLKGVRR